MAVARIALVLLAGVPVVAPVAATADPVPLPGQPPGQPPGQVVKGLVATPLDAQVTANGFQWEMSNACGTDDGLPTGIANGSAALGVLDVAGPSGVDAFDCGGVVWVGNTAVADDDGTVDVSPSGGDQVVTPSTMTIGGLRVTDTYRVFSGGNIARILVRLENTTGADVSTTVTYASNFGSDATTTVAGTSSGDTSFTTADRWLVTADGPVSGDDLVNTTVLYGPGSVDVTPSSVSQSVFDAGGREGAMATFPVTVPAGSTRFLMLFQQVGGGGNGTQNAAIVAAAAVWNTPLVASSPLLAGLAPADAASILNWTHVVATPPTTGPPATIPAAPPAAAVGVVPTFTG
jgi:hypothetical protein